MKHLPVAIIAAALSLGTSLASTISLNALGTNPRVRLDDGMMVTNGSLILAGYFADLPAAEPVLRNGSLIDVKAILADEAQFKRFGNLSAEAGSGTHATDPADVMTFRNVFGADGSISGSINGVTNSYAPVGERIFMIPLNAADLASATQIGIYSDSSWLMPIQDADLTLATQTIAGNSTEIYRGSFVGAADVEPVTELRLAVPEPDAAFLIGMAGFAVLLRRRRR